MAVEVMTLPEVPLSMAVLLNLEPPQLRRLLKQGLRRGLLQAELEQLLHADWQLDKDSSEARDLLASLAGRGWFLWHPETKCWKTHLG
ncbi:hypothetical protein KBY75_05645 [Cyanobium sp. T1G-Tous]|uniref:hypothetical protein n=1 Tax=Cyanobium sp. T1G-Tous TaxID=2823722 RepID=UPI0020CCD765|nr:hypothetical protein [Cyanobium sp. T1G-Tous]MCP9803047.1 hypothetical protein [Cyanobium sp. T1G-Tous]